MRAVPLILATLFLAACGGSDSSSTTPTRTATGSVPAVDYTRAGGVGGTTTHLTVGADGGANLDGYAFSLDADERAQLAAAAKGVDFAANAGHDRGDAHPDAYVYGLRVNDTAVLREDYVIPTPVGPVINVLERIATNHSPARRKLEADARDKLVVMTRDGGVAAQHIELQIAPDGSATVAAGNPPGTRPELRTFTVHPQLLDEVKRALAPGPDALRSARDPNISVADGFEYVVITGGQTINAGDPIENPKLERLLRALEQVLEQR